MDNLFESIFFAGRSKKKIEPDPVIETQKSKNFIIKTVLNQDTIFFPKGTIVYVTKQNWIDVTHGTLQGWLSLENIGTNDYRTYEKKHLDYDSSNEQSYSIIIQNVKRYIDGYKPQHDDPENKAAVLKYVIESTVIVASCLTANEAFVSSTKIAEALNIERVESPKFIDNLYLWNSLSENQIGKGVKIIVQPD